MRKLCRAQRRDEPQARAVGFYNPQHITGLQILCCHNALTMSWVMSGTLLVGLDAAFATVVPQDDVARLIRDSTGNYRTPIHLRILPSMSCILPIGETTNFGITISFASVPARCRLSSRLNRSSTVSARPASSG